MRCGLYGKLPAKRDYIAVATPREFLAAWEPWIQGGIAASRTQLGPGWQAAFLRAPIWRFWLGADICGAAVLGALMPSVDGVGRYFPLTMFARADGGETIRPPELDAHEPWFAQAENLLLSTLSEGADFDAIGTALAQLPPPDIAGPDGGPPDGAKRIRDGTYVAAAGPASLSAGFGALRLADHARSYAGMTQWWTAGGDDFPPRIIASRGMPDPYIFAGMLTGQFDDVAS